MFFVKIHNNFNKTVKNRDRFCSAPAFENKEEIIIIMKYFG